MQGLLAIWPRPSAEAWAYVAAFGVAQALMQLYVPGKVVKGPVTPKGNVPVYVVCTWRVSALLPDVRLALTRAAAGKRRPVLCADGCRSGRRILVRWLQPLQRHCPAARFLRRCIRAGLASSMLPGCTTCLGRSWPR